MYRSKYHMVKIAMVGALVLIAWLLAGCSQLEEIQKEQQQQLTCHPIEANGCIGFLEDKSIMLIKEENIQ